MSAALLIDFGSTFTKLRAVDLDACRIVATAQAPSTVSSDVNLGLDAALAGLAEEFRVPVVLRDVADLDYASIGEILDLAPGTVRSRIARGRARAAALLDGNPTAGADVEVPDPTAMDPP